MTVRPEAIALIADLLRNPATEIMDDPQTWKHEDGSPVTPSEAAILRQMTLGEVRAALARCAAETDAALARFN